MSSIHRPKVSVVTTTYNHEKYIAEALDGFLAQVTDFDVEILVADDRSSDSTPVIVGEYADAHPSRIRPILRSQNIGMFRNTVETLRSAQGDYIAICNGDDYWTDPTKLQRQADLLDATPALGLCFHRARVLNESHADRDFIVPDPDRAPEFSVERLLVDNFIPNNSVMYRRRHYDDVPDVRPPDWYLHLYHATFGDIGFIDRVMSVYRMHPQGAWAATEDNQDERWARHGIPLLRMQVAAEELFRADAQRSAILRRARTATFGYIGEADRSTAHGLLQQAVERFPGPAADTIAELQQAASVTAADISWLQERVEARESQILDLASRLAAVQKRVQRLKRKASSPPTPTPLAHPVLRRAQRAIAPGAARLTSALSRLAPTRSDGTHKG